MYSDSLKYPWMAYLIGGAVGLLMAYSVSDYLRGSCVLCSPFWSCYMCVLAPYLLQVYWLFGKPVNHYIIHKYLVWQEQCRELGLDAPPIPNDDSGRVALFSFAEPSPHSTTLPQSPTVPSRSSERKQHGFFEGTLTAGVGYDVISLDAYVCTPLVGFSYYCHHARPLIRGVCVWVCLQHDGIR
jgi:hypothetical protein